MAILSKKRAEKPDSSMLYNDLPQKCAFLYAFIFTSSINQLLKKKIIVREKIERVILFR